MIELVENLVSKEESQVAKWELWDCGESLVDGNLIGRWYLYLKFGDRDLQLKITQEEAEIIKEKFEGITIIELPF